MIHIWTRISLEARNAISRVWLGNYKGRDQVLIGTGLSVAPFSSLNIKRLRFMVDIETFEDGQTNVQSGLSWFIGSQRVSFVPSVGALILGKNLWGEIYHSATAGFSAKLAILELSGAFEYCDNDQYNFGTRLAFAW